MVVVPSELLIGVEILTFFLISFELSKLNEIDFFTVNADFFALRVSNGLTSSCFVEAAVGDTAVDVEVEVGVAVDVEVAVELETVGEVEATEVEVVELEDCGDVDSSFSNEGVAFILDLLFDFFNIEFVFVAELELEISLTGFKFGSFFPTVLFFSTTGILVFLFEVPV